jgi:hypothetical protein
MPLDGKDKIPRRRVVLLQGRRPTERIISRARRPSPHGSRFRRDIYRVQYSLSRAALIITQGSTVLSIEPMWERWSA